MDEALLEGLTPHDREEVETFAEFLRLAGDLTPENAGRRRELIENDPDRWLPYLGLTREWAREHGYRV